MATEICDITERTAAGSALDLIAIMVLLAVWVVVPMALSLTPVRQRFADSLWLRAARACWLPAALAISASFWVPNGALSGALAAAWLVLCVLVAAAAVRALFRHRRFDASALAFSAGMCFLPVGAVWIVLSRAGGWTMGFEEPIVLLTGVHFHYTAFAGSILAGMVGLAVESARPEWRRWHRAALVAQIAGTPLLAAGFVVSPMLQLIAVMLLAAAISIMAGLLIASLNAVTGLASRLLLTVSSYSVFLGMLLAAAYGVGEYLDRPWITIPEMATTHGLINGFGFVLCGLIGWGLTGREGLSCVLRRSAGGRVQVPGA